MEVGAERILEIVRSLKVFSHRDESESKPVDIQEGIDSTLMLLSRRLQAKSGHQNGLNADVEVIKEYGKIPLIKGFPGQLNQVFMNILANAIDAINEKMDVRQNNSHADSQTFIPRITICTEVTQDKKNVVIKISDNGIGMPEELRQKIFEQFFSTKPVGQGTGLGLSISRQIIVTKHQGTIEVYSTPEKGSEFVITLPLVSGQFEASTEEEC